MLTKLKDFLYFLRDIYRSRNLILQLAKNDFKVRYVGSYLGIIWAFVQPVITILVFWFVFQVGFRTPPVGEFPFLLWMICGLIPWFFFSESLVSATNSLLEYSYLVKKVVFRVSVLPIVKITSSLFVHLFFIFFLFFVFFLYGYMPNIYYLQAFYYSFATAVLVLGLTWITSSLVIFLKDTSQIVNIILQVGFWMTPIFWSYTVLPERYLFILKLNPMFYIVEGYRDSLINQIWFWQKYNQTLYFWAVTLTILITGALLFKRLRPHFSDLL